MALINKFLSPLEATAEVEYSDKDDEDDDGDEQLDG